MRTGPRADDRYLLPLPRRRWLRRLLLAVTLVVVVLSVVGMHQLSVGHDIATGPTTLSSHSQSVGHVQPGTAALAMTADSRDHLDAGMSGGGAGHACPDCADHLMALGSCLLALTLLVLSWFLAPPPLRHVPPFLVPRLALVVVQPAAGRRVPPLSLAELSLRRT